MKDGDPTKYKQLLESIVREAAVNPVKGEDMPAVVVGSGIQETPKVSGLLTSLSALFEDVDKFWLEDDKPDPLQIRKQRREQEHIAANLANVNKVASMMGVMTQESLLPRAPPPISSKQRASIFTGMKSRLSTIAIPKK